MSLVTCASFPSTTYHHIFHSTHPPTSSSCVVCTTQTSLGLQVLAAPVPCGDDCSTFFITQSKNKCDTVISNSQVLAAHAPSVSEILVNPHLLSSPSFDFPSHFVRAMFPGQPDVVQPKNKCWNLLRHQETYAGVTCQNRKCNDISRTVFLCLCFEFSRCRNKVENN